MNTSAPTAKESERNVEPEGSVIDLTVSNLNQGLEGLSIADRERVDEFLQSKREEMLNYARKILGGFKLLDPWPAAEDAVQEATVRFLSNVRREKIMSLKKEQWNSYFRLTVRSCVFDSIRAAAARGEYQMESGERDINPEKYKKAGIPLGEHYFDDPEKELSRAEKGEDLNNLLLQLLNRVERSDAQGKNFSDLTILMGYIRGFNSSEIAMYLLENSDYYKELYPDVSVADIEACINQVASDEQKMKRKRVCDAVDQTSSRLMRKLGGSIKEILSE